MGYPRKASGKSAKEVASGAESTPQADAAETPADAGADAGHAEQRQAVVMRLKRVEGQIRGVLAMIDAEAPCDAVAQQLAAARKALDRAFYEMMACDLERELGGIADGTGLGRRLAEKTRLLAKYG